MTSSKALDPQRLHAVAQALTIAQHAGCRLPPGTPEAVARAFSAMLDDIPTDEVFQGILAVAKTEAFMAVHAVRVRLRPAAVPGESELTWGLLLDAVRAHAAAPQRPGERAPWWFTMCDGSGEPAADDALTQSALRQVVDHLGGWAAARSASVDEAANLVRQMLERTAERNAGLPRAQQSAHSVRWVACVAPGALVESLSEAVVSHGDDDPPSGSARREVWRLHADATTERRMWIALDALGGWRDACHVEREGDAADRNAARASWRRAYDAAVTITQTEALGIVARDIVPTLAIGADA